MTLPHAGIAQRRRIDALRGKLVLSEDKSAGKLTKVGVGGLLAAMKALTTSLVIFVSLNLSFAQKKPNLDDPKVREATVAAAFDWGKLEERGKKGEELYYAPNQQTPYSGWAKYMHDNGRIRSLVHCMDGKGAIIFED